MERKRWLRLVALGCALLGVGVIGYVFYPIIGYEVESRLRFAGYLSPVPPEEELTYAERVERGEVDFTKPTNWFAEALEVESTGGVPGVTHYTLSIPALKIKDATVTIGGEDLRESLIQYLGTALPGRRGNAVVFGHSILPQFFNPKDYLTIFSTLPEIEKGDEVRLEYDGITYAYKVEDIFEVKPTDIEILGQNTSDSFVTLVTCVPPGHPLRPKRLVVRARLMPFVDKEGRRAL